MQPYSESTTNTTRPAEPEVVQELRAIFSQIPSAGLLKLLAKHRWTGRRGFDLAAMWHAFLASYYLNLTSTAALVRALADNPYLSTTCGFNPTKPLPHRTTFSRFFGRLTGYADVIHELFVTLTDVLGHRIPGFGEIVSVDSTPVKTYSNPQRREIRDPEASWAVRGGKAGVLKKDWVYGFKLHLAIDAQTELPIGAAITTGSAPDGPQMVPLLFRCRSRFSWLAPRYVLADKAYDSGLIRMGVSEDLGASAIIDVVRRGGRFPRREPDGPEPYYDKYSAIKHGTPAWKKLYSMRVSVERVNSRLKETRRLERHCFRGARRIIAHCLLALVVLQAKALSQIEANANARICVRKVA